MAKGKVKRRVTPKEPRQQQEQESDDERVSKEEKKNIEMQYAGIDTESEDEVDMDGMRKRLRKKNQGYFGNIKWTNVAILFMLTGTAVLPLVMFIADNASATIGSMMPGLSSGLAPIGVKLGFVATPKIRLTQFYEKHNPEKLEDVEKVMLKYAGDYKTMTKKLEAKYNDYGFFIGWEQESDFRTKQKETLEYVQKKGIVYYQRYMPWQIRQALRNIYLNLSRHFKKAYRTVMRFIDPPAEKRSKKPRRSSRR